MYLLILGVIYLAFIGLGSADALFGSAWPTVQMQMDVPLSYAGIVTMLIASGTITSSLLSARLIKRFGAGKVVTFSVFLSASALLGFSFATSFWMLCLLAFPLGLAGGSIDATLNNHVALHYSSRHMSWLHCFWGLGAVISPFIMGYALTSGAGWNSGYRMVFFVQITVAALLMLSLPLWKRQSMNVPEEVSKAPTLRLSEIIKIKGVKYLLFAFFAYCAVESTAGLWASSFLVRQRGIDPGVAASYTALFFIGITVGRFISGFIANKVGDKNMIRGGILIAFLGIIAVGMPITSNVLALNGLVIIGLGCAPIFPAVIHSTPFNFGKERSQSIIGVQMASAYAGTTVMPPLFGLIATHVNIGLFPVFLFVMAVVMLVMIERLNRIVAQNQLNK
jgi:fucose permease